jgi:hypothetical protein
MATTLLTPVGIAPAHPARLPTGRVTTATRRLLVFKEGARHPVIVPCGRPVLSAANGGKLTGGDVPHTPADGGKRPANLVLPPDHQPAEAGELVLRPHHHVIGAGLPGLPVVARLMVADKQVAQTVRGLGV